MIGRLASALYVAAVAGLTAAAFSGDGGPVWAKVAVALLALPSVIPALPAIYLLGAFAWTFADSPSTGSASSAGPVVEGPPIWPVTLTFTVVMTLVACANVALAAYAVRVVRRRVGFG